eukprot:scaffold666_cov332-Prasinococcus_capsulatus_cf.AAC.18
MAGRMALAVAAAAAAFALPRCIETGAAPAAQEKEGAGDVMAVAFAVAVLGRGHGTVALAMRRSTTPHLVLCTGRAEPRILGGGCLPGSSWSPAAAALPSRAPPTKEIAPPDWRPDASPPASAGGARAARARRHPMRASARGALR